MFAHVFRNNESDQEGIHQYTSRVTFKGEHHISGIYEPVLILGTLPHTTVIKMKDIRWFWIEEN